MVSFRILFRLARADILCPQEVREFQSRENTSRIFLLLMKNIFAGLVVSLRALENCRPTSEQEENGMPSAWLRGQSSRIESAKLRQMCSIPGMPMKHV